MIFLHRTRNSGNDYLHLIYALAGHEIEEIEAVYFNGRKVIEVSEGFDGIIPKFQDSLIFRTRLGTANQSAITATHLPTDVWTSAHRCRGIPLLYLRLRGSADDFPTGIPNVTVLVKGRKVLDPRTGLREYSNNAALCLADYMSDTKYGLGAALGTDLDESALIAAANVCDEIVPKINDGGGNERRYQCNGIVSLSRPPKENIEALLTSFAGHAVWIGTRWKIHAGAYRAPMVALTGDDLLGLSVATRISRADNFNGVRGQFVSPSNDWQADDFPAYRSAVYAAEDGEDVWRDIALPFTTSVSMAQRLAKIELERARRQQTVRAPGKLAAWRAASGETVTLDYARWGYEAKPFEVANVSLAIQDGQLLPELTLRETSPLVYSWEATEEQIYAAARPTTLPDPFDVGLPGTPALSEDLYATRDGTSARVKLRADWTDSDGPFLDRYQVQARRRLNAQGAATGDEFKTMGFTDQTFWEILDVAPGTWDVQIRAINTLGASSDWQGATREVIGLAAEPAPITGLTIQTVGVAVLKWDLHPDLDVRLGGRIVIRHSASGSPSWANSVSMDEAPGNATMAVTRLKPGTYLVRAIDSTGVPGPIATVSTSGFQAVPFTTIATLTEHPTWTGGKTNVTVNGSDQLTLTDVTAEGVYTFSAPMDLTTVRNVRVRSLIDVAAENLNATFDSDELFDSLEDFDGTSEAETDVIVEAQITNDNPSGTPTWSDWFRIDATEEAFRGARFRARLISHDPEFNLLLSGLTVTADEVA
jgi:hypothetical protein